MVPLTLILAISFFLISCCFTLVVAYDMVGVGAVRVATRPDAWQDWLAVK